MPETGIHCADGAPALHSHGSVAGAHLVTLEIGVTTLAVAVACALWPGQLLQVLEIAWRVIMSTR